MPADRNIPGLTDLLSLKIDFGQNERDYLFTTQIDKNFRSVFKKPYLYWVTGPAPYNFSLNNSFPFHNNKSLPPLSEIPVESYVKVSKLRFIEQASDDLTIFQDRAGTFAQTIYNQYTTEYKELNIPPEYQEKLVGYDYNILSPYEYTNYKYLGSEKVAETVDKINLDRMLDVNSKQNYYAVVSVFGDLEYYKKTSPKPIVVSGIRDANLSSTTNTTANTRDLDYSTTSPLTSIPNPLTSTSTGKYWIWLGVDDRPDIEGIFGVYNQVVNNIAWMNERANHAILLPDVPSGTYLHTAVSTTNSVTSRNPIAASTVNEVLLYTYKNNSGLDPTHIKNMFSSASGFTWTGSQWYNSNLTTSDLTLSSKYQVPGFLVVTITGRTTTAASVEALVTIENYNNYGVDNITTNTIRMLKNNLSGSSPLCSRTILVPTFDENGIARKNIRMTKQVIVPDITFRIYITDFIF